MNVFCLSTGNYFLNLLQICVCLLSVKYQCCHQVSVISYGSPHLEADSLLFVLPFCII